ncbi:MAG: response regulator [bacterium]|nr:response regulator [bacterium]
MSHNTVLVIDDSATIRKLVDTHLSSAGYRVVLAASAEEGLELAPKVQPDLILLDHQLPGTTGHNVATQLAESETLRHIPVVISSTLRKKAYVEYTDLDNVVDMLPKPYTEELLKTTVANAIETAAMIVTSQSQGGAVPEIINALDEPALTGNLACFGLRELLDFLNNGRKVGVLEVEAEGTRVRIHLEKGRIQGVYAQGIDPALVEQMIGQLPPSLASLAAVLKMTIGGRNCAEIDGFVQLLDQKVLDPRLMSKLLRFQAAQLLRLAFTRDLVAFRFEVGNTANSLHKTLPLEISLLALLVEGAIFADEPANQQVNITYVRRAIRGQNLDRTGLSARHMKVLNVLTDPKEPEELAQTLGWDIDEVHQVLQGFELAELVERRKNAVSGQFVVFEPNSDHAHDIRESLEESDNRYSGKVVRDKLALQLVLKRSVPHTLVFAGDEPTSCDLMRRIFASDDPRAAQIKRVVMTSRQDVDWNEELGFHVDATLNRPCAAESLFQIMDQLLAGQNTSHDTNTHDHQHGDYTAAGAEA